jgi:enoyl-CoA hydratase
MPHIETTTAGHVLEIHVNRADKLNALSPEMYRDLALALAQLDRIELDKWGPIFASGGGFPVPENGLDPFAIASARCTKPLVMAVQGYCYTWGTELMLTTDVRVAADDTRFAMLEVKRGIYPCGGATIRLPQQMGWSNAMRHLLTGEPWSAAEALRTGLVQEVVPAGQQLEAARAIALRIAAAAPLGVQAILKSSRRALLEGERAASEHMFDDLARVMRSEDAAEGVRSFIERREAQFKGR